VPVGPVKVMSVEHPSGEFTVEIQVNEEVSPLGIARSSLVRTARPLFTGHVFVPVSVWDGSNHRQAMSSPAAMTTRT
jgi:4-oxalomesaconate tautomerase